MRFKKVNDIRVKNLNFKNPYKWPTYSNTTQDNSFVLGLISGIRNAGKSTLALNFIELEKDNLLKGSSKVYFVSPTKDQKVEYFIEKYPEHFEYVDELTKENLEKVLKEIKERVEDWKDKHDTFELLNKYLNNPKTLTFEELDYLENMNYLQDDDDIEQFNFDHPPLSTLILDDSVGVPMICEARSKDGRWFQRFVLRHRHFPYYCNVLILSQHIKGICKYYRTNANWTVLFPFRDYNVLKSVFDEYSVLFNNNLDNFLKLMEDIRLKNNHSFCSIYYDKIQYIREGWNNEITFDEPTDKKKSVLEEVKPKQKD